jgi:hypothetical protein
MADRTSAEIFAMVFDYLADEKVISKERMADMLWDASQGYDFTSDQMGCDDALVKLGLAMECACGFMVYKGAGTDWHDITDECNVDDWKHLAEER